MTLAMQSSKLLTDLEREASAVLIDSSKEMTLVSSTKDIAPIVATAKRSEGALSGIQAHMRKATGP